MYATCLFCHAPLGANDTIERFPVGRRLAFDAAKGRLWVVCVVCRQWNLSPLEERWEAIEAAERLYRDTRLRVATDQVGLARLGDGTELVRIGRPLLPEFAAWRYGGRFSQRWRKYLKHTALLATASGSVLALGPVLGLGFTTLPVNLWSLLQARVRNQRVVARLLDDAGPLVLVEGHVDAVRVVVDPEAPGGWRLSVPHHRADAGVGRFVKGASWPFPRAELRGAAAVEAARQILPVVNRKGARARTVDDAVRLLEASGDLARTFARAAQTVGRDGSGDPSRDVGHLPAPLRLALEMAAHEDVERRAMEGELDALAAAWREAEEVAAIADDLTLPERIVTRLERLGGGA